jgi:hypothetical protein
MTCNHPYVYRGVAGNLDDDRLREADSFDPYMKTDHDNDQHTPAKFFAGTCACNDCINGTGLDDNQLQALRRRQRLAKLKTVVQIGAPLVLLLCAGGGR